MLVIEISLTRLLSFTVWKTKRARFSIRHVHNFVYVAEDLGWPDPARHAMVISQPGEVFMMRLMFKKSPFTAGQIAPLRAYAARVIVADQGTAA